MTWFKRITFFAMVNLGIILMLSLITNLLGIRPYLEAPPGIDLPSTRRLTSSAASLASNMQKVLATSCARRTR